MKMSWVVYSVAAVLMLIAIYFIIRLQDDVVTFANGSGNEVGILVDAQSGAATLSDRNFTSSTSPVDVGLLTAAASSNEVIAFTNSRPVAITTPAMWTSGLDSVPVTFAAEIEIPVTVWILAAPFAAQQQKAATRCVDIAAMWTAERMGVAFSGGGCDIKDATSLPGIGGFLAFNCSLRSGLQAAVPPDANRINVYVVDTVEVNGSYAIGNGQSCGSNNFVALGSIASAGVGIHELGHNFALTHIDFNGVSLPNFDETNIMHSASATRQYFTEGQLVRAHFEPAVPPNQPGSALNVVYNARPGLTTRDCPPSKVSDICPALSKRIWADGAFPPN